VTENLTSISKWSYARCAANRFLLLLEYLFNLADLLLDFAGEFFVLAFGFQVGVVRDLSGGLFDAAFQFMKLALDLIFVARFHRFFLFSFENYPLKLFPVFGAVAVSALPSRLEVTWCSINLAE
jgi:hypothetical protein